MHSDLRVLSRLPSLRDLTVVGNQRQYGVGMQRALSHMPGSRLTRLALVAGKVTDDHLHYIAMQQPRLQVGGWCIFIFILFLWGGGLGGGAGGGRGRGSFPAAFAIGLNRF